MKLKPGCVKGVGKSRFAWEKPKGRTVGLESREGEDGAGWGQKLGRARLQCALSLGKLGFLSVGIGKGWVLSKSVICVTAAQEIVPG